MPPAFKATISAIADAKWLVPALFGPYLLLHWLFSVAEFNDSFGYLLAAKYSPFEGQFWDQVFLGHRPVAVVLLFGLWGTADAIKYGHAVISFFAWAYFAYQFSHLLPERRQLAAFLLFAGILGGDVLLWNRMLLSESLSISGEVALLGFMTWMVRDSSFILWRGIAGTALLITIVLQSRDSTLLLLLGAVPVLVLVAIRHRDRSRRIVALSAIAVTGLSAALQVRSMQQNPHSRYVSNLANVLGKRILTSDERTLFFVRSGMPLSNATECLRGRFYYDCKEHDDMRALEDWLSDHGPLTFLRFLAAHPITAILEPLCERGMYLSHQHQRDYWFGYPAPRCHGQCDRAELIAYEAVSSLSLWNPSQIWVRQVIAGALGAASLFALWHIGHRRIFTGNGVLIAGPIAYALVIGLIGGILTYQADAMEVSRHMLPYALLLRLGCLMLILVAMPFRSKMPFRLKWSDFRGDSIRGRHGD